MQVSNDDGYVGRDDAEVVCIGKKQAARPEYVVPALAAQDLNQGEGKKRVFCRVAASTTCKYMNSYGKSKSLRHSGPDIRAAG